jgi:hypothetical protein
MEDVPLLRRPVHGTPFADAIGTLPYSLALAQLDPSAVRKRLAGEGLVAMTATVKPGLAFDEAAWSAAGFEILVVKEHFLRDPELPETHLSARTRRNLRMARAAWQVRPVDPGLHAAALWEMHHKVCARREVSTVLDHPPAHFERLARMPGMTVLGAFDGKGLGAFLAAGCWRNEVHFFSVASSERGYVTGASYALYDAALNDLGRGRRAYLGGEPRIGRAEGVAKFKARFANATAPVRMIRALLDPGRAAILAGTRGTPGWFPPYRGPYDPPLPFLPCAK